MRNDISRNFPNLPRREMKSKEILNAFICILFFPFLLSGDFIPFKHHPIDIESYLINTNEYPQYVFIAHVNAFSGSRKKMFDYIVDSTTQLKRGGNLNGFNILAIDTTVFNKKGLPYFLVEHPEKLPGVSSLPWRHSIMTELGIVHDSTGIQKEIQYYKIAAIENNTICVSLSKCVYQYSNKSIKDKVEIFKPESIVRTPDNLLKFFNIFKDSIFAFYESQIYSAAHDTARPYAHFFTEFLLDSNANIVLFENFESQMNMYPFNRIIAFADSFVTKRLSSNNKNPFYIVSCRTDAKDSSFKYKIDLLRNYSKEQLSVKYYPWYRKIVKELGLPLRNVTKDMLGE